MMVHVAAAPRVSGIYRIWHIASGKTYVGSSSDVRKRAQRHLWELEGGTHGNAHLQRAWNRDGADAFGWALLFPCPSDQLVDMEQWFMDAFRVQDRNLGFNIIPRADRTEVSNETRERLSAALRGGTKPPRSAESRERYAAALRGRKLSPETLAKRRATLAARTPEEKRRVAEKVSSALKGRAKSPEHRASMATARADVWASWTPEKRAHVVANMTAANQRGKATRLGEPS